jgi:hypothetical protein
MSRPALIPYAGKDNGEYPITWQGARLRRRTLYLFREGLDTAAIADDLGVFEHEVAQALTDARERGRQR